MYLISLTLIKSKQTAELIARFSSSRYAEHQLLWELTGEAPEAKRHFIYRASLSDRGIEVLVLSEKPFTAVSAPWQVRSREYAPKLMVGHEYLFGLRMSPQIDRVQLEGRSVRSDLVMDLMYSTTDRLPVNVAAQAAATQWLKAREKQSGFRLIECEASQYQRITIVEKKPKSIQIPSLEISGALEITDPEMFLARQAAGFGRAKFAGMGLMTLMKVH